MIKKNFHNNCILIVIFSSIFCWGTSLKATGDGEAGTMHLFSSAGVGARAMGLGNAFVAMPFDASAIYWNPAGMEYIQKKSLTLFYTNLLAGTQYNFVGYVHPTINFGTLGAGAIRVGTGDIKMTDEHNVDEGTTTYQESQFLISYAKRLPYYLSAGISIKFNYFYLAGDSDTGVGADIGLLYKPNFSNIFLRNISIGLNLQNVLQPRLKPREGTDAHPQNLKFGIAKPLKFNEWGSQITLFLDFEQGGAHSPFKYHTGTEYIFRDRAMLRFGMNNSQLAFGAGIAFNMFQLDYSYGKFAQHELEPSHRISLTVTFGKSKDELIRIAEEKKLREINRQVAQKVEWERNEKIARALEDGKRYFEDEDYLRAQREFNVVIGFEDEIPDAIEIKEAKELLKITEEKYREQMEKALAEIQARNARERKLQEDRIFINDHFKRGLTYYEHEEYEKAISEWNKILEREPENKLAVEHIKKAKVDYTTQLYSLIRRADALGKKGKYYEAINLLNKAIGLNPEDKKIKGAITNRKARYEKRLSFYDLYRQGINYQIRKEYKKAMEVFERALAVDPRNKDLIKHYEEAKARAFAKREPMTGEVKTEFLKSLRLINEGRYQEALEILETLQRIQPYNKEILDGIDTVREKIEQQKRNTRK